MRRLAIGGDDHVDLGAEGGQVGDQSARAQGLVVGVGSEHHQPALADLVEGRQIAQLPRCGGGAGLRVSEGHHGRSPARSVRPRLTSSRSAWC